jgi:hypothetical protein
MPGRSPCHLTAIHTWFDALPLTECAKLSLQSLQWLPTAPSSAILNCGPFFVLPFACFTSAQHSMCSSKICHCFNYIFFFCQGWVWTQGLLGRSSATWVTPPALSCFLIILDRVLHFCLRLAADCGPPSYLCLPVLLAWQACTTMLSLLVEMGSC